MLKGTQAAVGPILLTLASILVVAAQDHHVARQFDPGVTVDIDAGRFRFDVYTGREKSEELEAGDSKLGAGISFRVKPLFKSFIDALDTDKKHVLVIRLGYEYSQANENQAHSGTHSVRAEGTIRWGFPKKVLVSDRSRFELRWVDGDPSFRYRNRLLLERPFRMFKRKFTPYGSAEAYWDSRFRTWNKFRYTGGVEVPLLWRSTIDLSYTRERCVTCRDPHTDILGANLNIFLKLKK
jgi:hypothetical protein